MAQTLTESVLKRYTEGELPANQIEQVLIAVGLRQAREHGFRGVFGFLLHQGASKKVNTIEYVFRN